MAQIINLKSNELSKLKAAVLYIVNKCGELDYFHLFKILYFADKEHYAKYGRRIIQDTFCALPDGPVPSFLYDAVKIVVGKKSKTLGNLDFLIQSLSVNETYDYILIAKESPDMDELSVSDIELLDKSILENETISYKPLSQKSHDQAWEEAFAKKDKRIDPLSMARSAGANEAMMTYIKESELINSLAN